jgi:Flp pilus assembly protein TadD
MNRKVDPLGSASLLLLFLLPLCALGQGAGEVTRADLGGRNTIAGVVFAPNGTPSGRGIRIRLVKAGAEANAATDDQGRFKITGLSSGSYTLIVDAGHDFEVDSQQVEVDTPRGALPSTEWVQVMLRFKPGTKSKPGVVDATMADVPERAVKHFQKAIDAAAKGNTDKAVEELLRAVAVHPEFFIAHSELGVQYQKLNALEKADEHLRIALKLRPGEYEPLANRGIVLVRMQKYADAEPLLREALKKRDDSAVVHFYLGRALLGQKRLDDAEPVFRRAFQKGGNEMIEARRALATIHLQRGENDKALVEIEAYLAGNPKATDAEQLRKTAAEIKEWLKANPKP